MMIHASWRRSVSFAGGKHAEVLTAQPGVQAGDDHSAAVEQIAQLQRHLIHPGGVAVRRFGGFRGEEGRSASWR
jgi:hypothetical protein